MNNNIFIPQKIRIGFQERNDTYTKKLAYVIYYDEKGTLRKAGSWESWRDKKIDPVEYDNIPMEGFVLNKKVGGYAGSWGNFRQAYVRVYDPRGFEFEISVPNLLYILEHTSSIKGKGLEGEFVYGWDGTELVLIPTCSPDYASLTELNTKRFENKAIKAKDLVIGGEYLTKDNKHLVYMGRFDAYDSMYHFDGKWFLTAGLMEKYARENQKPLSTRGRLDRWGCHDERLYTVETGCVGKRHFFTTPDGYFYNFKSISGLFIDTISTEPATNYAELFERMEGQTSYSPYDSSKDKIRLCSDEENIHRIKNANGYWWSVDCMTMIDGEMVHYNISHPYTDRSNPKFICSFKSDCKGISIRDYFEFEDDGTRDGRMIPLDVTEIFAKLPPYCIDQYLQNGKFYRRVYA